MQYGAEGVGLFLAVPCGQVCRRQKIVPPQIFFLVQHHGAVI